MVNDVLANTTRAAHDVGLAAWLGGTMFGKFALNPSLKNISDPAERGATSNAAWNGYNVVNALGLGAAALGWGAARFTETQPSNLSGAEKGLSLAKDILMGGAVVSGLANGIQGARLARQAPGGRVPVETGTKPSPDTPPQAAKIQRSLEVLGNVNIVTGVSLTIVNAVLSQVNYSRPQTGRALRRSSSPGGDNGRSPLWLASGVATAAAAVDQVRRQVTK
jgi:hypothetical protein